jgi:CheY-like chemotaxis protein
MPILSGVKALVVDDHRDSVVLLAAALEPFGVGVVSAASAAEARQILSGAEVDVIVCDLGLPGENGLEFIRSVRALPTGCDVPAIAVDVLLRALRRSRGAGRRVRRVSPQADRPDRHRARGRYPGESRAASRALKYDISPQEASIPKPTLPTDLPADPLPLSTAG